MEIRRHGIWGTICDDDFHAEDAAVIRRAILRRFVHLKIFVLGNLQNDGPQRSRSSGERWNFRARQRSNMARRSWLHGYRDFPDGVLALTVGETQLPPR